MRENMPPITELRLLQCVVAVAEELSFTRAARKLYLSQPALSRQISDLERSLGVKLFDRTTRQVTLTPGGIAFLEEARAAISHSERAGRLAKAISQNGNLPVSVGYSPHYNFDLLNLILKRSECRFGRDIIFTSSFTREQVRNVSDGIWDAGLCFFPVEDPALETLVLVEEPVRIIVPKDHRLAVARGTVSYSELKNEPAVRFARKIHPGFGRELEQVWATCGYHPRATHDVNTVAEAVALVAAGAGVAFLKSSLRDMLPPTVKMLISPQEQTLMVKMGVLYRKHGRSLGAGKFLELMLALKGIRKKSASAGA